MTIMFPLTFIDNGNTLPAYINSQSSKTPAEAALSTSSASSSLSSISSTFDMLIAQTAALLANSNNLSGSHINIMSTISPKTHNPGSTEDYLSIADVDNSSDGIAEFEQSGPPVPPLQRPETLFIIVLFTLIFIVGVLGNGTLVIIFFRHRSMRNIPNTYILSLALADLLVIITCVPLATLVYTTDSWTFGKSMCQVTEFFKDVSIGVSVFTLTALSGERYCAIVNPLRKLQTKPLTVITATFIWVLAIMFATPSLIVSDLQTIPITMPDHNLSIIICSPFGKNRTNVDTYSRYVVVTKAFIYYLLPLFIIGVLYMMMAQRLHVSARDMPGETLSVQSRSQIRARRYVARMVVAFVVVFFVCFFPYHLFELWFHLNPDARDDFDDFWHTIRIIGFCTYFLNSCVNPVALYCVSGVFRAHFNQYLCCLCVKRQTRIRQHSTATGMMDTSIMNMSMRSTTVNYNRASVHLNNTTTTTNGSRRLSGGGGGGYRRQSSLHMHPHTHANGEGIGAGSLNNNNNAANGRLSATAVATGVGVAAQTGVILSDKR